MLKCLIRMIFLGVVVLCKSGVTAELPNIILCMGDDHGWEETGYNGHPHVKTPVLDEMAASGLRLDHFYAGHPSCSPTRGSFLTGRHPNRFGTFTPGHSIRPEEITIAHLLRDAGYRSAHFGKWHLGPVKSESPTNPRAMGFDEYVSHDNFFELNPPLSRNGEPHEVFKGESSAIIVEEAIKFIDQSKANRQPFLVVIWFGSPHEPYSGLPQDLALYDNLPEELAKRSVRLTSNETGLPVNRPLREVLRERLAEITAMDRGLGTLRDHLREQGLRDNTLLWYCGDNGTPSSGIYASPFRGEKGTLYEGGIRVPGVIEWPARIPSHRISNMNAVTSDILPTVCSIAGVDLPARPLDGVDLLPMIDGKEDNRSKPICFWMYDNKSEVRAEPYIDPKLQQGTTPLVKLMRGISTRNFLNYRHAKIEPWNYRGHRVILDGKYKLHAKSAEGQVAEEQFTELELYDLRVDSAETNDIAADNASIVERMKEQLLQWQSSVLASLCEEDY